MVAVEAQQRVEVEHQRRDAGDEDHVEGQRVERARRGVRPHQRRHGRHGQLRHHPGGAHQHALAPAPETPARAGVHVGQRRAQQQHHAHLVHLAAEALASGGVAELVDHLGQQHADVEQPHVARRQQSGALPGQLVGVVQQRLAAQRQQQHVGHRHRRAEERPDQRQRPLQQPVRVQQRDADGHETHQQRLDLAPAALAVALEKRALGAVLVEHEQVREVELAQQLHHLLLRQRVLGVVLQRLLPGLVDGALQRQPAQEGPGVGRDAEPVARQRVAQHEPRAVPEHLPVRAHAGAQRHAHRRHAVPGIAEGLATGVAGAHGHALAAWPAAGTADRAFRDGLAGALTARTPASGSAGCGAS